MFLLTVVLAAALFIGAMWLLGPLLERIVGRAARRATEQPVPEGWLAVVCRQLPLIAAHAAEEQDELLRHARDLLSIGSWEGAGGLELTTEMSLIIATQAVLLTWKRNEPAFPRLKEVLVYPSTFRPAPRFEWVADRDAEERVPALGESWASGTVVLAWDDVVRGAASSTDGHNVVLHEFAHQLDTADGIADGIPALDMPAEPEAWHAMLLRAYGQLDDAARAQESVPLDQYALTNRAEFFAVATESFFERPRELRRTFPELYRHLADFYRQDPAERLERRVG